MYKRKRRRRSARKNHSVVDIQRNWDFSLLNYSEIEDACVLSAESAHKQQFARLLSHLQIFKSCTLRVGLKRAGYRATSVDNLNLEDWI